MKILGSLLFAVALPFAVGSNPAVAGYPDRPIRLIVPFGAGSGADIVARQIAQGITKELKQTVIVDDRPGAGGNIAAALVARSTADGYTIMLGSTGPLTVNASLYGSLTFDPVKDFSPIGVVAVGPMVIAVRSDSPFKSLADLVATSRSSAKPLSYGSSGVGSGPHLAALLLERSASISMTHIPYKGTADAVNDLLGGNTDIAFSGVPSVLSSVLAGKLRLLAATSESSIPELAQTPTTVGLGYKDTDLAVFYGLVAPSGTPREVIDTLNAAVLKATADEGMKKRFAVLGLMPQANSPEEFADLIRRDSARWRKNNHGKWNEGGMTAHGERDQISSLELNVCYV